MRILTLLLFCFTLGSCYYDIESELYPNCEVPETVSYELDIKPLAVANCASSGCHTSGGEGPGNFNNYNSLKSTIDNGTFELEVLINKSMPPSSSLPDCDLQIIQSWLDAGAPNN